MTPSSPPSYTFLDTQPSPLLTSIASKLPNPSTNIPHQTSIPTASPITDPTQSPPHTGPNSPGPTFPTNQPTSHEPNNIQTQTQNNPLPPPIFDPPNPQTNTNPVNEPPRTHPMITRSQSGIVKPIERLSLHTSSLSPIPKSPFIALKDPNWCNAKLAFNRKMLLFLDSKNTTFKASTAKINRNGERGSPCLSPISSLNTLVGDPLIRTEANAELRQE
ncbi:hypothetical protein Tco_1225816 [Tanacetum coccineum]